MIKMKEENLYIIRFAAEGRSELISGNFINSHIGRLMLYDGMSKRGVDVSALVVGEDSRHLPAGTPLTSEDVAELEDILDSKSENAHGLGELFFDYGVIRSVLAVEQYGGNHRLFADAIAEIYKAVESYNQARDKIKMIIQQEAKFRTTIPELSD
jgi:hypothetical protein